MAMATMDFIASHPCRAGYPVLGWKKKLHHCHHAYQWLARPHPFVFFCGRPVHKDDAPVSSTPFRSIPSCQRSRGALVFHRFFFFFFFFFLSRFWVATPKRVREVRAGCTGVVVSVGRQSGGSLWHFSRPASRDVATRRILFLSHLVVHLGSAYGHAVCRCVIVDTTHMAAAHTRVDAFRRQTVHCGSGVSFVCGALFIRLVDACVVEAV